MIAAARSIGIVPALVVSVAIIVGWKIGNALSARRHRIRAVEAQRARVWNRTLELIRAENEVAAKVESVFYDWQREGSA